MKAISLLQPWASLVVEGVKGYETRGFNTNHRGKILIHASLGQELKTKGMPKIKTKEMVLNWPFNIFITDFSALPFGAIIGCVDLIETYKTEEVIEKNLLSEFCPAKDSIEYHLGDYSANRFAWKLENPIIFKHQIPIKGNLSIWNVPPEESWIAELMIESSREEVKND
ncbi:ASCH domain-containing protein [Runella sp.]|uniref:ASCH domain-containing protein n=1 Tax=Runella sp. TaxID=1960881 RepID=UPI003D0FF646